jgi:hypothetical protein
MAGVWRRSGSAVEPGSVSCVSRALLMGFGALLVVVGAVWFLQGIDVLGGSGMSGKTLWAVIGPVVALGGAAMFVTGLRKPTASRDR